MVLHLGPLNLMKQNIHALGVCFPSTSNTANLLFSMLRG